MPAITTKTAIVTGASRGIGRHIALRLAQEGFAVVVNYNASQEAAQAVVAEIEAAGGQALAVAANVAQAADVARLFATAIQAFGGVDVLVNNAGISALKPLADTDDALLDQLVNTNVRGTLHGLRQAARHLRMGGRIINFSSTAVASATPGLGAYIATKAAVEAMTRVFAKELKGRNITVNAIAPGLINSEMFAEGKTDAQIQQMAQAAPLGRLGEASEIASIVAFLVREDAAWVNGQIIRANGGVL